MQDKVASSNKKNNKLLIIKVCGSGDLTKHVMEATQRAIQLNTENHKLYGEIFEDDFRVLYYFVPSDPKNPCRALNPKDFDEEYERIERTEEKEFDEKEAAADED